MKTGVLILGVVALGGLAAAAIYFTHKKSPAQASGGGRPQQFLPARQYAQNHGVNRTGVPPVTFFQQALPAIVEALPIGVTTTFANSGAGDTFVPDVPATVTDMAGGTTTYFGN
jgi:hypothetical protein